MQTKIKNMSRLSKLEKIKILLLVYIGNIKSYIINSLPSTNYIGAKKVPQYKKQRKRRTM